MQNQWRTAQFSEGKRCAFRSGTVRMCVTQVRVDIFEEVACVAPAMSNRAQVTGRN